MPKKVAKKKAGPAFGTPEWRKKHGLPIAKKKSTAKNNKKGM